MSPQSEIFPQSSVTQDSPRLAWIKKHNIITHHAKHFNDEEDPWCCIQGTIGDFLMEWGNTYDGLATGKTEQEAVLEWAKRNKVPLWNEEAFVESKKL